MSCSGVLQGLRRHGFALALVAVACSSGDAVPMPPEPEIWVDVGIGAGPDGLDFERLEPGGSVPLYSFGQGGTHALLAVRCSGLGDRAFVSITIADPASGVQVSAPAGQSPRLLACSQRGVCDLIPVLVMTGGLVAPGVDRAGLAVSIRVDAENAEGTSASVERGAVLSSDSL
jgi:hypothetical protein